MKDMMDVFEVNDFKCNIDIIWKKLPEELVCEKWEGEK